MAEYIDREAAIQDFEKCNATTPKWPPARVKTLLLRQPAADVEPVVRCKDCKWDRPDILLDKHWCSYFLGSMEVRADDFCSHGARRADNG